MFMAIENWTFWSENLMDLSMQGYTDTLGVFVWPLIFTAIIGYVYLKNQSVVTAAAAVLILFGAFINTISGVDPWATLMMILICLAITGLLLYFIIKRRGV